MLMQRTMTGAMELSAATRHEYLKRLQGGVEVLVIGGGVTGAGVALDAASRGLRVGLVEAGDFASGTSSRSTKLVHGGIRYLPQFDLGLIREALHERAVLLRIAPHLVRPLPFLIPLYSSLRKPLGMPLPSVLRSLLLLGVGLGLHIYDLLAGRAVLARHRWVPPEEVPSLVPLVRTDGLRGGFVYHDAQTDDVRLTLAVLRTAVQSGAVVVNYARVVQLAQESGRVAAARIRDELTDSTVDVRARHFINAAGVWAEDVARMAGPAAFSIRHSKGAHLVVRRDRVRLRDAALVIPETNDGRLAFVVPWGQYAILGTTDDGYEGDLASPIVTREDVAYLLDHVNQFMDVHLTPDDVAGTYAGLRPLLAVPGKTSAQLSRTHAVMEGPAGMISIIGGKLTTFRKMAQDCVDYLLRREQDRRECRTAAIVLDGGEGTDEAARHLRDVAGRLGWDPSLVNRLTQAYGSHASTVAAIAGESRELAEPFLPGMPIIAAEVVYAARYEMAMRLVDLAFVRLPLAIYDIRRLPAILETVAAILGRELGWTDAVRDQEIAVARAHAEAALTWASHAATLSAAPSIEK